MKLGVVKLVNCDIAEGYVPAKALPFRIEEAPEAIIHLDRIALADVRFSPEVASADEAIRRANAGKLSGGAINSVRVFSCPA